MGAQLVEAKTAQIAAFEVSDVLFYFRQQVIVPVGIKSGDQGIENGLGFLRHAFAHLLHDGLKYAWGSPVEQPHPLHHNFRRSVYRNHTDILISIEQLNTYSKRKFHQFKTSITAFKKSFGHGIDQRRYGFLSGAAKHPGEFGIAGIIPGNWKIGWGWHRLTGRWCLGCFFRHRNLLFLLSYDRLF